MNPGTTISHYRIVGQLGRGGMGIVYKAEDAKLNRTVALKLLPPDALTSADEKARFYREARAAAALNHPNIAHVYEIDEADAEGESRPFIAMEFIDGETLDDRIAKGPLPLKDSISIATQIAEGLKTAHRKDVVHRDVKSGNVMITKDGVVKVLDFGLAKTAASTKLTQMGSTLGTVAYMSPEQARGEEVDRRSDIWSLGVILYEMITGRLPFRGDYEQAVVYGILNEDPESMTTLRAGVPMALDGIIAKLLAKDPDLRYQNVDELPSDLKRIDISTSQATRISTTTIGAAAPVIPERVVERSASPPRPGRSAAVIAAALVAGLCLGATGFYLLRGAPPAVEKSVKRLALTFPAVEQIVALDVTPDGSSIVYVTAEGEPIRVLDLNDGSIRTLDGTEGALVLRVSPDGNWVMMTMPSGVKRASLHGGKPIIVVESTTEPGPYTAWAPDERLIYEDFGRLWIKPIVGGTPEQLTDQLEGEVDHDWPFVLPDGKTMAATIEKSSGPVSIGLWDLEKRERIGELEIGGYAPRWIPTGHLVYELDGELLGVPFDLSERKISGVPVSLESYMNARTFGITNGGTLVSLQSASSNLLGTFSMSINRLAADGEVTTLPFDLEAYWDLSLAPDETRLAVEVGLQTVATEQDIWVLDLDNGFRERLTFDNSGDEPTWSPDGDSLMYVERLTGGGASRLVVRSADGRGGLRVVYSDSVRMEYPDWSPDGRYILFSRASNPIDAVNRTSDVSLDGAVFTSLVLLDTADETLRTVEDGANRGRFSPDGRFIAYQHRGRVFAKPISLDGGVWDISDGPGRDPQWSPDGGYVYFLNQLSLMRVELAPGGGRTQFGNPETVKVLERQRVSYAAASGGRFVYTGLPTTTSTAQDEQQEAEISRVPQVNVVVNWFEHVKRMSPNP